MSLDHLTEFEKDLLLQHFLHHLPQRSADPAGKNNRATIGREYPGIYNRLYGREIVAARFPHEQASVEELPDGGIEVRVGDQLVYAGPR